MNSTQMQYRAFLAAIAAALIIALAPLVISGIRGVALPDGLISIADKSVAAFGTLLGTIGGLLFRQSRADEQRVDNTAEAFKTIQQAQSMPASNDASAIREGDSVTIEKGE